MKPYSKLTKEELKKLKGQLEKQFEEVKAKGIHLDMSRGKPSKAQLDLSNGLMDVLNGDSDLVSSDGVDCRNYGVLDGITEARKLLADMSEVPERNILIYGNSSLNVMFDTVSRAMTHGIMGSTPDSFDCRIFCHQFLYHIHIRTCRKKRYIDHFNSKILCNRKMSVVSRNRT